MYIASINLLVYLPPIHKHLVSSWHGSLLALLPLLSTVWAHISLLAGVLVCKLVYTLVSFLIIEQHIRCITDCSYFMYIIIH